MTLEDRVQALRLLAFRRTDELGNVSAASPSRTPVFRPGVHAQRDRHALFAAHRHDRMERAAVAEASQARSPAQHLLPQAQREAQLPALLAQLEGEQEHRRCIVR